MRGLCRGGNNANSRMRHASLGILVCIIWEEWNKRILDGTCTPIASLFRKFQILFYTIFHFHEHDHFALHIGWCYALCSLATLHFGCAGCLHHFLFSSLPSAVSMAGGGGSFICTPPSEMCFLCLLCLSLSGRYCIEIIYKSDHEAKLGYQTGDRKMKCLRRGCKQINFNRGWIPKNNNASSTRCICIRKILSLSEPKSMHTSNSIEEQFGFK